MATNVAIQDEKTQITQDLAHALSDVVDADVAVAALVEQVLARKRTAVHGSSDASTWPSPSALWRDASYRGTWYDRAAAYWRDHHAAPPTVDGVLGGFANLDAPDAAESRALLRRVAAARGTKSDFVAADVAAGIGRVAKHVLLACGAARVDVLEQSAPLLRAAPAFVDAPGESGGVAVGGNAANCRFVESAMQTWRPAAKSYDVIWTQWCVGHLTDSHFVRFLDRCRAALTDRGFLVIKDNCLRGTNAPESNDDDEAFVVDDDDRSVCRTRAYYLALFETAGATILEEAQQPIAGPTAFPDDIYPVLTWALAWP